MVLPLVPAIVGALTGGTLLGGVAFVKKYYDADPQTRDDMDIKISMALEKIPIGGKILKFHSDEEAADYFKRNPDAATKLIMKNPEIFKPLIEQNPDMNKNKEESNEESQV